MGNVPGAGGTTTSLGNTSPAKGDLISTGDIPALCAGTHTAQLTGSAVAARNRAVAGRSKATSALANDDIDIERYRPFEPAPRPLASRHARAAGPLKAPGHPPAAPLTILDLQRVVRCSNATSAVRFAPAFLTQLSLADAGRGGNFHG